VEEPESILTGEDGSDDILVEQCRVNGEAFGEETYSSTMIRESDEANPAVFPAPRDLAQVKVGPLYGLSGSTMNGAGCSLSQLGIPVVLVVESFKTERFLRQMDQARESLSTEEAFVVGVIEAFDDPIAPRFSFRDKDDLDTSVKAEANHQAETAWITVGTSERKLVVNLEEPRHAQALPLSKKSPADRLCLLGFNDFEGHSVAIGVDKMAAVKANTAGEITGPDKVQLLQITWARD
jgi:hypothetical protein